MQHSLEKFREEDEVGGDVYPYSGDRKKCKKKSRSNTSKIIYTMEDDDDCEEEEEEEEENRSQTMKPSNLMLENFKKVKDFTSSNTSPTHNLNKYSFNASLPSLPSPPSSSSSSHLSFFNKPLASSMTMNLALISGIILGIIVLISVLLYALHKYRSKDFKEYPKEVHSPQPQAAHNTLTKLHSVDFHFSEEGGEGFLSKEKLSSEKEDEGVVARNEDKLKKKKSMESIFVDKMGEGGKRSGIKEWFV